MFLMIFELVEVRKFDLKLRSTCFLLLLNILDTAVPSNMVCGMQD